MRKPFDMLYLRNKSRAKGSKVKIIHPTQCKCGSANILGRGMVCGLAYVNLEDFSVDELGDEFEVMDSENLFYECSDCGRVWE